MSMPSTATISSVVRRMRNCALALHDDHGASFEPPHRHSGAGGKYKSAGAAEPPALSSAPPQRSAKLRRSARPPLPPPSPRWTWADHPERAAFEHAGDVVRCKVFARKPRTKRRDTGFRAAAMQNLAAGPSSEKLECSEVEHRGCRSHDRSRDHAAISAVAHEPHLHRRESPRQRASFLLGRFCAGMSRIDTAGPPWASLVSPSFLPWLWSRKARYAVRHDRWRARQRPDKPQGWKHIMNYARPSSSRSAQRSRRKIGRRAVDLAACYLPGRQIRDDSI